MAWDDNSDYGGWGSDTLGTNAGMDMGRGDLGSLGTGSLGSLGMDDAWGGASGLGGGTSDEPGVGTTIMGLLGGGLGLVFGGPFGAIAGYKGGRALAGYANDAYDYLSSGTPAKGQQQAVAESIGGPGSHIDWGAVDSLMGSSFRDNNNGSQATPGQGQSGQPQFSAASTAPNVVGQQGLWIDRKTGLQVHKVGDDAQGLGIFVDPSTGRTYTRDQVLKAGNPKAMSLFPSAPPVAPTGPMPTGPAAPGLPYGQAPPINPALTLTQDPQSTDADAMALYDSMNLGHLPASGFGMERQWTQPSDVYALARTDRYSRTAIDPATGKKRYAEGGPIMGPGTDTSDNIPALLSPGEFVFTARAVRGKGQGDQQRGIAALYREMHAAENQAGRR
jgi:hypothetical protein